MKLKIIVFLLLSVSVFAQNKIEVFFDFNVAVPNEKSNELLQKWMKENPNVTVYKLSGYCDSIDVSSYNKELSLRRIKSVLNLLKEKSIKISNKVELQPFGKDFKQSPIQAENRKVVIYYEKEEKLAARVKTSKKGDLIKLKNLYFFNNSDKIKPISEPVLTELLSVMNENPKLKIEIQGHVCCGQVGSLEVISSARAKAVYDFLIKNKIQKNRMSYIGFGFTRPIHPIPEKNTTEEDENRRVEIMIVEN